MLTGNRVVRILFILFFVLIIALNLWFWVVPHTALALAEENTSTADTVYHFKGFNWFFNQITEFPGIEPLVKDISKWLNMKQLSDNNFNIEDVLAGFKFMMAPIMLVFYLCKDIVLNVIWIFKFLGLALFGY